MVMKLRYVGPNPLGVDDICALPPSDTPYLGTKRKALYNDVTVNKNQKVACNITTQPMMRAEEKAASTSNNPIPTFIASTINCNHQSKLWFMGN